MAVSEHRRLTLEDLVPILVPIANPAELPSGAGSVNDVVVNFDPRLRWYVLGSAIATILSLIVMGLLPSAETIQGSQSAPDGFFWVLKTTFGDVIAFAHDAAPAIITLDVLQLVAVLAVGAATDFFARGELFKHWWAFWASVMGALNGFVLSVLVGIFVLNVVIWIVVIVVAIAVGIGVLIALASASNSR